MLFVYFYILALALGSLQLRFTTKNSPARLGIADHQGRKFVSFDRSLFSRNTVPDQTYLTSSYNFYYTYVDVGSPPQKIEMIIDTGSPITWAYGPKTTFKNAPQFLPNKSDTFVQKNDSLNAQYGSGQYFGKWGSDTFTIPGDGTKQTTSNFSFGLVSQYATGAGIPGLMGLSPHIAGAGPDGYKTLPEAFFDDGVTSSSAFSISLDKTGGDITFGGMDLSQIEYPIYSYDVLNNSQSSYSGFYTIGLDKVGFNNQTSDVLQPCFLDSGSPMTLLPTKFVKSIGDFYNLTLENSYNAYYTNGTTDQYKGFVTVQLGNFNVDLPVKELFVPGEYIWGADGPQGVQALSIMGSMNNILGDSFFKAAYTIFDGRNNKVFLARRKHGAREQNVVPISGGLSGVAVPGKPATSAGAGSRTVSGEWQSTIAPGSSSVPLYGNNQYIGSASNIEGATVSLTVAGQPLETASDTAATASGRSGKAEATQIESQKHSAIAQETAASSLSSASSSSSDVGKSNDGPRLHTTGGYLLVLLPVLALF